MRLFVLLFLLSSCASTTEMAAAPPFATVHSAKARGAVAECLLNRLSSDELLPRKDARGATTTVSFASRGWAKQPAVYVFTIRDEDAGSSIEVHRLAHANLATAETCF